MATIDLSCSSANGSGFKNYAKLRITYTASNGTLKITEIAARRSDGYRSYDVYDKQISVTIGGATKTIALDHYVDFGANSWVTWQAADTSWAGLTGNSISITATMPASTVAFSNATFKGNASMSWSTYTVSYNANGGKGAPSAQTKTYGTALTLSSTKPTRTGYIFKGWATSASGAVTYASGASYTANAAITLYAVWQPNTYTVSYNANGGTGAPGNQTKTYGTDLTLSSTEPTRLNYNFKGWGVSASATTVKYAAGAKYTANEAATLYAVWELAYTKPRITKFTVARCTSNGTLADDGTFALVKFDWACDKTLSSIVIVAEGTTLVKMVTASGNSGSVSEIFGDGSLSTDQTYTIAVHVGDQYGETDESRTLNSQKFAFDALPENKGVAFGKVAELEDTAEFAYDAKFNNPVYGRALGMDRLPEIPENSDFNEYLTTGCYAVHKNATAETISNIPIARAGRLEVWAATGEGVRLEQWSYLRQRFIPYNQSNAVWERDVARGDDNVWHYYDWYKSSLTPTASAKVYHEQKILWGADLTSGMYMTEGHTANLTEAVSAQPNGIVLVFSAYNSADDTNYSWQSFFVPKQLVGLSTSGHTFNLCRGKFTYTGTKYLYIYDTYIKGHVDNNLTGTSNGITYANNKFVLRYVIGV